MDLEGDYKHMGYCFPIVLRLMRLSETKEAIYRSRVIFQSVMDDQWLRYT